jgi:hypothetical protein
MKNKRILFFFIFIKKQLYKMSNSDSDDELIDYCQSLSEKKLREFGTVASQRSGQRQVKNIEILPKSQIVEEAKNVLHEYAELLSIQHKVCKSLTGTTPSSTTTGVVFDEEYVNTKKGILRDRSTDLIKHISSLRDKPAPKEKLSQEEKDAKDDQKLLRVGKDFVEYIMTERYGNALSFLFMDERFDDFDRKLLRDGSEGGIAKVIKKLDDDQKEYLNDKLVELKEKYPKIFDYYPSGNNKKQYDLEKAMSFNRILKKFYNESVVGYKIEIIILAFISKCVENDEPDHTFIKHSDAFNILLDKQFSIDYTKANGVDEKLTSDLLTNMKSHANKAKTDKINKRLNIMKNGGTLRKHLDAFYKSKITELQDTISDMKDGREKARKEKEYQKFRTMKSRNYEIYPLTKNMIVYNLYHVDDFVIDDCDKGNNCSDEYRMYLKQLVQLCNLNKDAITNFFADEEEERKENNRVIAKKLLKSKKVNIVDEDEDEVKEDEVVNESESEEDEEDEEDENDCTSLSTSTSTSTSTSKKTKKQ